MKFIAKIWWTPFLVYIIWITSFINSKVDNIGCRSIEIEIRDSLNYSFVTSDDIFNLIHNEEVKVLGKSLTEENIRNIEQRVGSIRELGSAEVYMTLDGALHVEADQRDPVMRIISSYGNSYFVDKYGFVIPQEYKYTPRLIAVSGNIEVPDGSVSSGDITSLPDSSMLKKLFSMVMYINNDEFWKGQIEQIWVNEDWELELIPRVGQHLIRFGSTERMEEKLNNLKEFYKGVLPRAGWNIYGEIIMKYDGQIVCKKR
ncbi:MAG TPA: hypothetical protein VMW76_01090 [Bacteroidales bacterium]|nr:hypothetical protein [Bacteroidales bacterium]